MLDPELQAFSKPPTEPPRHHFIHTTIEYTDNIPKFVSTIRASKCTFLCEDVSVCKHCLVIGNLLKLKQNQIKEKENVPLHKYAPLTTASKQQLVNELKTERKKTKHLSKELANIKKRIDNDSVEMNSDLHNELSSIISKSENLIEDLLTCLFWEEQKKAFSKK